MIRIEKINSDGMNVQDLIDRLEKIEDKTKIIVGHDKRTKERNLIVNVEEAFYFVFLETVD